MLDKDGDERLNALEVYEDTVGGVRCSMCSSAGGVVRRMRDRRGWGIHMSMTCGSRRRS
jgi:hypothetical protein